MQITASKKVVFDNGSEFKRDFTTLLKDFDIKPVLKALKNPQANTTVERGHQAILNMLATKYLDKRILERIYPWCDTLAYTEWEISTSYHCTIMDTPGQAVFGRDMLFYLMSAVYWQVVTTATKHQVYIDNVREMLGK